MLVYEILSLMDAMPMKAVKAAITDGVITEKVSKTVNKEALDGFRSLVNLLKKNKQFGTLTGYCLTHNTLRGTLFTSQLYSGMLRGSTENPHVNNVLGIITNSVEVSRNRSESIISWSKKSTSNSTAEAQKSAKAAQKAVRESGTFPILVHETMVESLKKSTGHKIVFGLSGCTMSTYVKHLTSHAVEIAKGNTKSFSELLQWANQNIKIIASDGIEVALEPVPEMDDAAFVEGAKIFSEAVGEELVVDLEEGGDIVAEQIDALSDQVMEQIQTCQGRTSL